MKKQNLKVILAISLITNVITVPNLITAQDRLEVLNKEVALKKAEKNDTRLAYQGLEMEKILLAERLSLAESNCKTEGEK